MLPIVLAFGLVQGALVERLGVRQAIKIGVESGWIMATIALGIIFKNLAENIWGRDDLKFPSPLAGNRRSTSAACACCRWRSRSSSVPSADHGWPWSCSTAAPSSARRWWRRPTTADAAGLMGINTSLVITFSYALSSACRRRLAGVLVAPDDPDRRHAWGPCWG